MKHTPGPWTVITESDGSYRLSGQRDLGYATLIETGYNARLIAAAPELLEALEKLSEYYRLDAEKSQLAMEIRQVIAKAKGD